MFKKDKKATIAPGQVDTLIGPQVVIRGDFHFAGGLYIEGRVIGKIIASNGEAAQVTIAESGVIEGEVRAPNVIINGQLVGDAYGELVEMHPKARVNGNVYYGVIEMAPGAVITGKLIPLSNGAAAGSSEPAAETRATVATAKTGA